MEQKTSDANQGESLVLIAEDQPVNQKLFSLILDKLGYKTIIANDGRDAIKMVQEFSPVLVIMDIQMPKMNGYEAAKSLRDMSFKKPIIAVTASVLSNEREKCQNAGIDDVMIKPFKSSEIEEILKKWIGISHETTSDSASNSQQADRAKFPEFPEESKTASTVGSTVFDPGGMLNAFMNNLEAVLPLLARFVDRTVLQLENFPALRKSGDWETARRDAHTIKGAALTLCGSELGNAAALLEKACKNASAEEVDEIYPVVCEVFLKFKKAAEDFIKEKTYCQSDAQSGTAT